MGRLFARLFKKNGHEVIICGRERRKAQQAARNLQVKAGNMADLAAANIVMVCVPIENTVKTCTDALRYMGDNTLLIEISSVKSGIVDRISDVVPPTIQYLSIHPLFGPSVNRIEGQNIIALPVKSGSLSEGMTAFLSGIGFVIQTSSPEEHDKVMAALQVMHHYAYLVMAVQIEKMIRQKKSISRFLTASLSKTLSQIVAFGNIEQTILSIQELNPYGLQSRKEFAKCAMKMVSMNEKARSDVSHAIEIVRKFKTLDHRRGTSH